MLFPFTLALGGKTVPHGLMCNYNLGSHAPRCLRLKPLHAGAGCHPHPATLTFLLPGAERLAPGDGQDEHQRVAQATHRRAQTPVVSDGHALCPKLAGDPGLRRALAFASLSLSRVGEARGSWTLTASDSDVDADASLRPVKAHFPVVTPTGRSPVFNL